MSESTFPVVLMLLFFLVVGIWIAAAARFINQHSSKKDRRQSRGLSSRMLTSDTFPPNLDGQYQGIGMMPDSTINVSHNTYDCHSHHSHSHDISPNSTGHCDSSGGFTHGGFGDSCASSGFSSTADSTFGSDAGSSSSSSFDSGCGHH